jgi:hypothetical protein
MRCYKLTDKNDLTYGGCRWGQGATHETIGDGPLCTEFWLHVYDDPLLAVMLNPIHGSFDLSTAHLWECEGEGKFLDDHGLKRGCTRVTTLRRIDLPEVTTTQCVAFGILCALEMCRNDTWVRWARAWIDGSDRSESSADEALAEAAERAAAGESLAAVASWEEAASAALAMASSPREASQAAAMAAARAARAARASEPIDLIAVAKKEMEVPQ